MRSLPEVKCARKRLPLANLGEANAAKPNRIGFVVRCNEKFYFCKAKGIRNFIFQSKQP